MDKSVKTLTFSIVAVSLIAVFFNPILQYFFNFLGFEPLLSLSSFGLSKGYFFEFFTYPFLLSLNNGLSASFLIDLFFTTYAFFFIGRMVATFTGEKKFLWLFATSTLFTGIVVAALFSLSGTAFTLTGPFYVLTSIIAVWGLISQYQRLFLFVVFPIETRFLAFGALAFFFLSSLASLDFLAITALLSSVVVGYLFTTIVLQVKTPFPFLHPFDLFFNNLWKKKFKEKILSEKGKIIDFETGEIWLDDEAFLNKILEKIAKKGESSLSLSEKRRFEEIQNKKRS